MGLFARFINIIGIDILAILYCTVLRARCITNVCAAMFSIGHTYNSLQCRRDALKYRYVCGIYRIECVNLLGLMHCTLALYRNACERERLTRF